MGYTNFFTALYMQQLFLKQLFYKHSYIMTVFHKPTFQGGMKAVVTTDTLQAFVMLACMIAVVIFVSCTFISLVYWNIILQQENMSENILNYQKNSYVIL